MTVKKSFKRSFSRPRRQPQAAAWVAALVAALAALALPACDSGTGPTTPGVSAAQIVVSVDPDPIRGIQNTVTKAVTATFEVKIQELNGLGGEVMFVSTSTFDPESGAQIGLIYFDGADLVVYIGTKRIGPKDTLVVPETTSYLLSEGRKEATVVVSVQVKDDYGHLINRSVMAQVQ